MKASMTYDLGEFNSSCAEKQAKLQAGAEIVMRSVGAQIKAYAKATARWIDRTGNARQGLDIDENFSSEQLELVLYHTMEYGFWLELAHQRRYKILEESIKAKVPDMIEGLRGLL